MENKKIYGDDVERVVNKKHEIMERRYDSRIAYRQNKLIKTVIFYAAIAIAFFVIGICDFMAIWIAFPVFAFCALYAAFSAGRFYENGKCWGFKKYEDSL